MSVDEHFSLVASHYRDVRFTDREPVAYIRRHLISASSVEGIELGCGTGRYTVALLAALGERLTLHCVDATPEMLDELDRRLSGKYAGRYTIRQGMAEEVVFTPCAYDAVFSFNALHHFDLLSVLQNIEEWLCPGGQAFLYTRTPSQNALNLWGQCFPGFLEKEDRLKSRRTLISAVEATEGLQCLEVKNFSYPRRADIDNILDKVNHFHYSTFRLYTDGELEAAREEFVRRLASAYTDLGRVTWTDHNMMLIIEKT